VLDLRVSLTSREIPDGAGKTNRWTLAEYEKVMVHASRKRAEHFI
jgi:hypothetical protein